MFYERFFTVETSGLLVFDWAGAFFGVGNATVSDFKTTGQTQMSRRWLCNLRLYTHKYNTNLMQRLYLRYVYIICILVWSHYCYNTQNNMTTDETHDDNGNSKTKLFNGYFFCYYLL